MSERPDGAPHPEIRPPWSRSDRPVPRRIAPAAPGVPVHRYRERHDAAPRGAWWRSPGRTRRGVTPTSDSGRTPAELRLGTWAIGDDLRHWVNDGLMTLFFLVVGLEIKREFQTGELQDRRAAALPVVAAIGGMIVPALIYLVAERGRRGLRRMGHPDGDGHRVRPRRARPRCASRAGRAEAVHPHAGDRGRHRRDHRHRALLRGRRVARLPRRGRRTVRADASCSGASGSERCRLRRPGSARVARDVRVGGASRRSRASCSACSLPPSPTSARAR